MTRIVLFFSLLLGLNLSAQVRVDPDNNVGIGTDNVTPSAKLQVESNNQGFLMPRLSEGDIQNIQTPIADGLQVYNTTIGAPCYYKNGQWICLQSVFCWDKNGDGLPNTDPNNSEDINGDGVVNNQDCFGYCWDLNGNGIKDLSTEDLNNDNVVDVDDCGVGINVDWSQIVNMPSDIADGDDVDGVVTAIGGAPGTAIRSISRSQGLPTLGVNIEDADANPSNELQTLSKVGNTVTLSQGGGSFTDEVGTNLWEEINDNVAANRIQRRSAVSIIEGGATQPLTPYQGPLYLYTNGVPADGNYSGLYIETDYQSKSGIPASPAGIDMELNSFSANHTISGLRIAGTANAINSYHKFLEANVTNKLRSLNAKLVDLNTVSTQHIGTSRNNWNFWQKITFPSTSTANSNQKIYGLSQNIECLGETNTGTSAFTTKFYGLHTHLNTFNSANMTQYGLFIEQDGAAADDFGIFQEAIGVSNYLGGSLTIRALDTDENAPVTTGVTRMVVSDNSGLLSFDEIPNQLWQEDGADIFRESRVGINTDNPQFLLDIHGAGAEPAMRLLANETSNISGSIRFEDEDSGDLYDIGIDHTNNDHLQISANGDGSLIVDNEGNIGVRVSPNANFGLYTERDIAVAGSKLYFSAVSHHTRLVAPSSTSFAVENGSIELARITRIGNNAATLAIPQSSSGGTAANRPILRNSLDTDTGIYCPNQDQIGFTVGGSGVFRVDLSGVTVTTLDTDLSAPTTTGTTQLVVTDNRGRLSFRDASDFSWSLNGNTNTAGNRLGTLDPGQRLDIYSGNKLNLILEPEGVLVPRFNGATGNGNIYIGYGISTTVTDTEDNTVVGHLAAQNLDDANKTTAIGYRAAKDLTSGDQNTLVGSNAGASLQDGGFNTFIGTGAGESTAVDASNCTYIGNTTGKQATGQDNTFVGAGVGSQGGLSASHTVIIGKGAGASLSSGSNNVFVGNESGDNVGAGSNNTAIGHGADFASATQNSSALGSGASVTQSNRIVFGNMAVTELMSSATTLTLSDERFKSPVVGEVVPGLDFILGLDPYTYTLDAKAIDSTKMSAFPDPLSRNLYQSIDYTEANGLVRQGFNAQDVEEICNSLGVQFSGIYVPKTDSDTYALSYSSFVVPLVKAVQEQQDIIEDKDQRIETLENTVGALSQQLSDLLERVATLESQDGK